MIFQKSKIFYQLNNLNFDLFNNLLIHRFLDSTIYVAQFELLIGHLQI